MSKKPASLGDLLNEVMRRRGVGRTMVAERFHNAWRDAAGDEWAKVSRPGPVRRGVMEVTVTSSTAAQELMFLERRIVKRLAELLPDERIERFRCKVGPIE
jgi:predicted nucleic acid-binding Zn ribbon protein